MGTIPVRYAGLALVVAVGATAVFAAPAVMQQRQIARAEGVRRRCVREFSAKGSWRADITETERGSDGATSVVRQRLLVRKPGEYRLTLTEHDDKGRQVVTTTLRTRQAFYSRRANADGTTELHVIRGARPSLGVELDNLLGQTVEAVADAEPLKIVSSARHNGTMADELQLSPGRFVWVDQKSGLPIEEQVISNGKVSHSVAVASFDDQAQATDEQFDPASLGTADTTTVEDLGFRSVSDPKAASTTIGFTPLDVPAPDGFSADTQGYVDPSVSNGESEAEAAFVSAFSRGAEGVIVTQVSRPGAGDSFEPDRADASLLTRVDIGGTPAGLFRDGSSLRLVLMRRDVQVTIEGDLAEPAMRQLAQRIR